MIFLSRSRNIFIPILIVLAMSLAVAGCSSKDSAEKKPGTSTGQKPKAPTVLKTIATDLDTIIAELDKKIKVQKMSPMQQSAQLDPQEQSGQDQTQGQTGGQSQGQSSGQSQNQSSGQSQNQSSGQSQSQSQGQSQQKSQQATSGESSSQKSSQKQGTDWQKEYTSLTNIHKNWNTLEPDAVEAGMSVMSRDEFEKTLDQLTQNISNQKAEESLGSAINLYKNYADLAQVFTMAVPAEFFQVKYEIMASIFEAGRKNWSGSEEHIPKIEEHWARFKVQAGQTDRKILNRTEFSIHDLEQAIKNQQMDLVIIKGEIVMNNLKDLEEKLSSQPSS